MKKNLKKMYNKLLPTLYVKHCSQTIYQALLTTIHMYKATNDNYWLQEAKNVKDILVSIQQKDGGFDIGYIFNFGYKHNRGESTSPELLSVVALIKYWEINPEKKVEDSIQKAISWIINNSYEFEDLWVIPYGPYSTKDVVVYNGISFAQAPLAMWSKYEKNEERKNQIIRIYRGMNRYLAKHLVKENNGSSMLYSVPRKDMDDRAKEKIDYYHMAQQLEMHNYANTYCEDDNTLKIVKEFGEHLLSKQDERGLIPYLNNNLANYLIHIWGYCSNINAFLDMNTLSQEERYLTAADKVVNCIINDGYDQDKNFFYPVLDKDAKPLVFEYYPRSDAWVINSLSRYYLLADKDPELNKIICDAYEKMKESNYSGKESHASSKTRMLIGKTIIKLKKL